MFIEISELTFRYRNAKEDTVKNFSIGVDKGEILAILGESGSGKSTILRLIAGLEKPSKGLIKVKENILVSDKIFMQPEKREVGMVFQDYALFPHMTVEKNIKYGLKNMSAIEKDKRMSEVLELVSMSEYANRYPHQLSGGQQQRIALARAMAPKPELLLLDEPFSNLDANLQVKIRTELKEILNKARMTAIFVTHDEEDATSISNKIVTLHKGEITKYIAT